MSKLHPIIFHTQNPMTDIFISYSHEDQPRVTTLAQALEAEGYRVWWDREILPGQDFETRIRAALANTKCVISIWSASSVDSKWVKAESNLAWEENKLIPLAIGDVFDQIPVQIRTSLITDFQDWNGDRSDPRFQQLLKAIDSHIHKKNTNIPAKPSIGSILIRILRQYWKWALGSFLLAGGIAGAALDLEEIGKRIFNPTPKLELSRSPDGEVNPGDKINLSYKGAANGYLSLWNQNAKGESRLILPQSGMQPLKLNKRIISGTIGLKARNETGTDRFILLWTPQGKSKHLPHREYETQAEFNAALKVLEDKGSVIKTELKVPVYPQK